jgi:hypothetical protein
MLIGNIWWIVPYFLWLQIFLFGEIMIEDEYNPTAPTEYASFKQKR